MKRFERLLAVIGAAALFVAGSAVATEASNGSTIKFGKTNKGTKTTTLQVTSGTAAPLKLQGNAASAPLVTNMTGQVANLNASMVGGASLSPVSFSLPASVGDGDSFNLPTMTTGTYLITVNGVVNLSDSASPAAPNVFACYLYYYDSGWKQVIEPIHIDVGQSFYNGISGSTVADLLSTRAYGFSCSTSLGGGWTTSGGQQPTISFVRLPTGSIGTLTPALVPPATMPVTGSAGPGAVGE
jgi:hypothetical protein